MTSNNHTYRLRPGRWSDIAISAHIYTLCFRQDYLLDALFPNHHEYPEEFKQNIHRIYEQRYWSPDFSLTVVVDETDHPVGCSWWRRPKDEFSFFDRWLSPYSWLAACVRGLLSVRDYLFPLPSIDPKPAGIFTRVFDTIKPQIFTSPRREQAWYLSILAVDPALQGRGLGSMLIRDGLSKAERRGKASYLIGLRGTDTFYNAFGFVEVARANIGELSKWDGGIVMFKE